MNNWTKYMLIALASALVACEQKTVDFKFSPTEPHAGQMVTFSNLSNTGEEWNWDFGDGGSSTGKNPGHTYKQPGQYIVTLRVDNKKALSKTHTITVYDTVPNFSSTIVDSVGVCIYEDITFTALAYNPYNQSLSYQWILPENTSYTLLSDSLTGKTLSLYFHNATEVNVQVRITLNGVETLAAHTYTIQDKAAEALLMRTQDGVNLRQRLYGTRAEQVTALTNAESLALLDKAQDTINTYNDSIIHLSALPISGITPTGFAIANRKFYLRSNSGLYVANMDGSHLTALDNVPVSALYADRADNRIYWATNQGLFYLPLVDTPNNTYNKDKQQLNETPDIIRLAKDSQPR